MPPHIQAGTDQVSKPLVLLKFVVVILKSAASKLKIKQVFILNEGH